RCYRDWSSDVCSSDLPNFSLFAVADSIHAWSARLVSLFASPPSIFLSLRGGTCRRRPDCSAETQLRNARVNDRLLPAALRRLLSCPRRSLRHRFLPRIYLRPLSDQTKAS